MDTNGHLNAYDISDESHRDSGKLTHAYIVSGSQAETLAMAVVCPGSTGMSPCMTCPHCVKSERHIHPDIITVDKLPDKREIVVEQLRDLKRDVIVVPNEAEKKAYIINNADSMNAKAQNAFLQILEEPPAHVVFILSTENPVALLPTVRSRCVQLKARREAAAPGAGATEMANGFFSAIGSGNFALTEFMFRLDKLEKSAFGEFLAAARVQAAARMRAAAPYGPPPTYEVLARAERLLARGVEMFDLNVAPGHISGMICASLIRT